MKIHHFSFYLFICIFIFLYGDNTSELTIKDPNLSVLITEIVGKPISQITLADIRQIEYIDGSYRGIKDLSGIEDLKYLKNLNLSGNFIHSTVPLSALCRLEYLNLNNNNLEEIKLNSNLYNLKYLSAGFNRLSNVEFVSSTPNIRYILLDASMISDLSPLIDSELSDVKIDLMGNTIEVYENYYNVLDERGIQIRSQRPLELSDLIKGKLRLSVDTNITVDDYAKIEELNLEALSSINIDELLKCKNIESLSIDAKLLNYDLAVLAKLPSLKNLGVLVYEDEFISGLNDLESLDHLTLLSPKVQSFSQIECSSNLRSIYLECEKLLDIEFLRTLSNLESLTLIKGYYLTDLSPIGKLHNLKELNLESVRLVPPDNYGALTNLTELELLRILFCNTPDLFFLNSASIKRVG